VRNAQPYTAAAFALGNGVAGVERQAMTWRG
jgi:hypothetical protein